MRTIAVINRKGGSGKTTTAVSLAAAWGEAGRRIVVLDLDPQGSASTWLGAGPDDLRDLFDAFVGTRELSDLAIPTRAPGVDLIPASSWLVTAERTLQVDLALGLIRALERIRPLWDTLVIDAPPTLGYLGSAALCACRQAIVPTEAHALDLAGVDDVLAEMERIQVALNPELTLAGIVVGRMNRTIHARAAFADLASRFAGAVIQPSIRDSIRVPEAAAAGLPVTLHAPSSAVATDIRAVAAAIDRRDPDAPPAEPEDQGGLRRLVRRLVGSRS